MRVLCHFLLWKIGLAKAETQTTDAERDCLARHAAGKLRLAEIGVWHGVSTCRLRSVMAEESTLFAVDPFPRGRLGFSTQMCIAYHEVGKVRNGLIHWMRTTGAQAAIDYSQSQAMPINFIFIDGDHSFDGLRQDWEGWRPLIAKEGIVCLHDSCSSATRAIDDAGSAVFTRDVILHDENFEVVEVVDTLTVLRRK